jgi:hypothetical protein
MSRGTQLCDVTMRSAWRSLYSIEPNTSARRASSLDMRSRNAAPCVFSRCRMISYVALPRVCAVDGAAAASGEGAGAPSGCEAGLVSGASAIGQIEIRCLLASEMV